MHKRKTLFHLIMNFFVSHQVVRRMQVKYKIILGSFYRKFKA